MKLLAVYTEPSPDTPACVRTTGVIALDQGEELRLWVDVPNAHVDSISVTGNPWLVAMLPIAATRGEPIELSLPVDALLLENLKGVLAIWREWYPQLHDVAITCPVVSSTDDEPKRTAAFFSGGIDSYFTIARRMPGNANGLPVVGEVDDLLTVWGFDVKVGDASQFQPLADMLSKSAAGLGKRHIVLRTNLRSAEAVMPFKDAWRYLSHGAGLAFAGLILERAYKGVIIGSSYTFGKLFPWGSHPMLDPLFSTSSLVFLHDGASFTRVDKTRVVAQFPPARPALHVCFAQGTDNCSTCDKCYRTMITIDALGYRDQLQEAFNWSEYRVDAAKKLFIRSRGDRIFAAQMTSIARENGRDDIVSALDFAAIRSRVLLPFVKFSEVLMSLPLAWRAGISLKAFLMRGPIRKI